jgi:hypothetical protein
MPDRLWVYHSDLEPKIIIKSEVESYHDDGWRESPALCNGYTDKIADTIEVFAQGQIETNKAKGIDVDKEHARRLAIDEIGRHQEGINQELNDTLNDKKKLKKAKKRIEKEMIEKFNHNPDMRKYKGVDGLERLEALYRELENGNS